MKKIGALLGLMAMLLVPQMGFAQQAGGSSINNLPNGNLLQPTDQIPIARGNTNYRVQVSPVATYTIGTGLNVSGSNALQVTYGTGAGTSAQGNDSRILGALQSANNLSDVGNATLALDNLLPSQASANGKFLSSNGSNASWLNAVTSVGFTADGVVYSAVSGSPVTTSGNLAPTLASVAAHQFLAGPTSGSSAQWAARAIIGGDLPNPSTSAFGGVLALASSTAHQVVQYINTSGQQILVQLGFSDLSGSVASSQMPAGTGDTTWSAGSTTTTTGHVDGVAYPASPASTNTVPVVTSTSTGGAVTYEQVPNAALANSSMTIAGHSISLGGVQTLAASDLTNSTTGSGNIVLATAPTIASPLFNGAVSTLSSGVAGIGGSSSLGGIFTGQGGTNDLTFQNKTGSSVCTVATGTTTLNCAGLQIAGVAVLTANQSISLSGDASGSGTTSIAVTVNKVDGVAYGASPSTNTVPVITSANTATYEAVPNAALANSSMTIAGHSIALGATQAIAAADLSNGVSGSGAVALVNSPTFTTPNIGSATGNISGNAGNVTGVVAGVNGGTGQNTLLGGMQALFETIATTLGDTVYGGVSGAPTRLAGYTTANEAVYSQTGTGSASAAPAWDHAPAISTANMTGLLKPSNNLSDVSSVATSIYNLYDAPTSTFGEGNGGQWTTVSSSADVAGATSFTNPAFLVLGQENLYDYMLLNGKTPNAQSSSTWPGIIQGLINSCFLDYAQARTDESLDNVSNPLSGIQCTIPILFGDVGLQDPIVILPHVIRDFHPNFIRTAGGGSVTNDWNGTYPSDFAANVQAPVVIQDPGSQGISPLHIYANSIGTDRGAGYTYGMRWQDASLTKQSGGVSGYVNGDTCHLALIDPKVEVSPTFTINASGGLFTSVATYTPSEFGSTAGSFIAPHGIETQIATTTNGFDQAPGTGWGQVGGDKKFHSGKVFDGSGNRFIICNGGGDGTATVSETRYAYFQHNYQEALFSNFTPTTDFLGDIYVNQSNTTDVNSGTYGPIVPVLISTYDAHFGNIVTGVGGDIGTEIAGADFHANFINSVGAGVCGVIRAGGDIQFNNWRCDTPRDSYLHIGNAGNITGNYTAFHNSSASTISGPYLFVGDSAYGAGSGSKAGSVNLNATFYSSSVTSQNDVGVKVDFASDVRINMQASNTGNTELISPGVQVTSNAANLTVFGQLGLASDSSMTSGTLTTTEHFNLFNPTTGCTTRDGGLLECNNSSGGTVLKPAANTTNLTVTLPANSTTLTTSAAQPAVSNYVPVTTTTGASAGNLISGTNVPTGAKVGFAVGTAAQTSTAPVAVPAANTLFGVTSSTGMSIGELFTDTTTAGAVPNNDVITNVSAGASIISATTNAVTSSGNTLHFASNPSAFAGMLVVDVTSPAVIPYGCVVGSSGTSTTMLTAAGAACNVTGGGVGGTDVIHFLPTLTLVSATTGSGASAADNVNAQPTIEMNAPSGTVIGSGVTLSIIPNQTGAGTGGLSTNGGLTIGGDETLSGCITGAAGTLICGLPQDIGGGTIAIGPKALNAMSTNPGSYNNLAIGPSALLNQTTASGNIGIGQNAGNNVTTGGQNVYIGQNVASSNGAQSSGAGNTAIGRNGFGYISSGQGNVAVGQNTGAAISSGSTNTAVGASSLINNFVGNTSTMTGSNNSVFGANSMKNVSGGSSGNTVIGANAGNGMTQTGGAGNNTIIGTGVAPTTLTSGAQNILLGVDASTDLPANQSNSAVIGNFLYVTNIKNSTNTGGEAHIAMGNQPTSITTGAVLDLSSNTTATNSTMILPIGTSGTRPGTGVNGMIRYNSGLTVPNLEGFINGAWSSFGLGSQAQQTVSFQPGLLTSVTSTKGAFGKAVKTYTVDNIEGSATSLTCSGNPVLTMYECGVSTTCATPTTIGSVTVTATGTVVDGTISNATITAGDYYAWAISGGTCTLVDVAGTAAMHAN